ncbi:hypothetical protein [Bradyrhizobium diazoefficiens]|uniref:hypothetical protein n=1 Tax=Bradyrhizobium diazoefficiens TaxID=1355477 RepID=UPI00272BC59F|nr:hypothetical protein [Bradyrhizobium diazoefficiens]WLA64941.1 hypothetical protein QNN01_43135 [Bradyrhizobium diazoefficiens]
MFVAIGISVIAVAPAAAQFAVREVPPENQFFRFKAQYLVKATGEVVRFDLVRPCRAQYAKDVFGDSVGLGPLGTGKYEPGSYFGGVNRFPKVTQDGHAIVVRIPLACKGETTANGKLPPDLLPFVSWFEDADDLTQGLMYATEDAYRSPLAKIEFRGASIEAASSEDFQDWLKHAAEGFRPSRDIQSPLGLTQHDIFGGGPIAQFCRGVHQVAFPPELVARLAEIQPPGKPRFWNWVAAEQAGTGEKLKALMEDTHRLRTPYRYGGLSMYDFLQTPGESSPTSAHGAFRRPDMKPVPVFPYSHIPDGMRSAAIDKEKGLPLYFDVDLRPEMRGFLSCRKATSLRSLYPDPNVKIEWRANGEQIAGYMLSLMWMPPGAFFENDTHLYGRVEVM